MSPRNTCLVGDAAEQLATLPAGCVQMCATSPPYWGLRDYGEPGQLGLEETPEAYVERLVAIFREVRRVLRDDGVLWLNLGDSYAGDKSGGRNDVDSMYGSEAARSGLRAKARLKTRSGLKPKDLVGIPWRVAFALQADGWWLRSDIIWAKPNPMPSSVTDRPTTSHEYVFLLSKSARYFYDADAIKEASGSNSHGGGKDHPGRYQHASGRNDGNPAMGILTATRNRRSVWTIATAPYGGAHFACWPPKLVAPMIQAGSSERGACADCGAPWRRVVERTKHQGRDMEAQRAAAALATGRNDGHVPGPSGMVDSTRTTGWESACDCATTERLPCVVLDPFMGSGTTGQVAQDLGRDWIGCELNPDYLKLQAKRTAQLGMFF